MLVVYTGGGGGGGRVYVEVDAGGVEVLVTGQTVVPITIVSVVV